MRLEQVTRMIIYCVHCQTAKGCMFKKKSVHFRAHYIAKGTRKNGSLCWLTLRVGMTNGVWGRSGTGRVISEIVCFFSMSAQV